MRFGTGEEIVGTKAAAFSFNDVGAMELFLLILLLLAIGVDSDEGVNC